MGLFNFVKHSKGSQTLKDSSDNAAQKNSHIDISKLTPTEQIIRYIDCPYKLIPQKTPISAVNKAYMDALRYGANHACTPIMIPVTADILRLLSKDGELSADIELIRELRRAFLWQINDSAGETIIDSAYCETMDNLTAQGINTAALEAQGAQGAAVNAFHSFIADGTTVCEIILAQIPTARPWEVFVWLPIGGIDELPSDNELICVSRHWYELCGAVPAVIGRNVIEYFVPVGKPDKSTAAQIARGHFAICPDRVIRMTQSRTISELADTLTKSCVWILRWKKGKK